MPDGAAAFKGFIDFLKSKRTGAFSTIKRADGGGDLVLLHVHSKESADDRGQAIVDIFRIDGGKIVEHWDVVQPVPEKAANDNTDVPGGGCEWNEQSQLRMPPGSGSP